MPKRSKKSIQVDGVENLSRDPSPNTFSALELKYLLLLLAETNEHVNNIGTTTIAVLNVPYLDQSIKKLIDHIENEALHARSKIEKIITIISIEKRLFNDDYELSS